MINTASTTANSCNATHFTISSLVGSFTSMFYSLSAKGEGFDSVAIRVASASSMISAYVMLAHSGQNNENENDSDGDQSQEKGISATTRTLWEVIFCIVVGWYLAVTIVVIAGESCVHFILLFVIYPRLISAGSLYVVPVQGVEPCNPSLLGDVPSSFGG